jgi:nicotinamidase-related amidase
MIARLRIGWVVDAQRDFMDPPELGGRLYVRHLGDPTDQGAATIVPTLARAVAWLGANCSTVVYTADWHTEDDREIDRTAPDFRETFPAHCMGAGARIDERAGASIVDAVQPMAAMVILDRDAAPADADQAARRAALGAPVMIRKREFSVFAGQRQTHRFLAALRDALGGTPDIIVCGVATDVCVRLAVEGFLDHGYRVTVIRDAVWGLGIVPDEQLFANWHARGARIVGLADLEQDPAAEGPVHLTFGPPSSVRQ